MLSDSLGPLLKTARRQLSLSRKELASRAGVSPRLVAELERGQRPNVSLESALKLLSLASAPVESPVPSGWRVARLCMISGARLQCRETLNAHVLLRPEALLNQVNDTSGREYPFVERESRRARPGLCRGSKGTLEVTLEFGVRFIHWACGQRIELELGQVIALLAIEVKAEPMAKATE